MNVVTEHIEFKKKLEKVAMTKATALHTLIRTKVKLHYQKYGVLLPAEKFRANWTSFLEEQYTRVALRFKKRAFEGVKEKPTQADIDLLMLAADTWEDTKIPSEVLLLLGSTDRMIQRAYEQAKIVERESGGDFDDRRLGLQIAIGMQRMSKSRIGNLAITETQAPAENTRFMAAEIAAGIEPAILTGFTMASVQTVKYWFTMSDSAVRRWHAAARNQKKGLYEPFEVGGERLMYPGDTSLGASAKNIARCRCGARYGS